MARSIEFIPEKKIEKALNVFSEKGYGATSLHDLVEAMQINKSSLYNSFKDKHSLFKECLQAYVKITEEDYRSAVHKDGQSPLQSVERIIDKIANRIIEESTSCLSISAAFELAHDKDVQMIVRESNENTIKLIEMLLKEAQVNGQLSKDKDCRTLAHLIFSTMSGLWYNYILYKDRTLIKQIARELSSLLRI